MLDVGFIQLTPGAWKKWQNDCENDKVINLSIWFSEPKNWPH